MKRPRNPDATLLWMREHLGAVAGVALVVAFVCWYMARSPDVATAQCRARYQQAHTARDTALADNERANKNAGWTCGVLRRSGQLTGGAPAAAAPRTRG